MGYDRASDGVQSNKTERSKIPDNNDLKCAPDACIGTRHDCVFDVCIVEGRRQEDSKIMVPVW